MEEGIRGVTRRVVNVWDYEVRGGEGLREGREVQSGRGGGWRTNRGLMGGK